MVTGKRNMFMQPIRNKENVVYMYVHVGASTNICVLLCTRMRISMYNILNVYRCMSIYDFIYCTYSIGLDMLGAFLQFSSIKISESMASGPRKQQQMNKLSVNRLIILICTYAH